MTKDQYLQEWHQQTSSFFGLMSVAGDFKRMTELIDHYQPILNELQSKRYTSFADEQGLTGEAREQFFKLMNHYE